MFNKILLLSVLITISIQAQNISEVSRFIDMEQYANARKSVLSLPENAENMYAKGDFYIKMSQLDTSATESLDSAMTYFNKGISLDPKNPLNYVGQGAIIYLQGNWDVSAQKFKMASDLAKGKNAQVFYKTGEAYLYKGKKDIQLATFQFENAVKLAPKNTDYMLALGDAYLIADDGSATRAVKQYNSVLAQDPKLAKAHIKTGKIYLQAKNYEEALKYYNKGIEVDAAYSPAYRERAELYFKLKQYRPQAPAEYKKYLGMSDGNYKSKSRFATMSFKNEDYTGALEQIKLLLAENSNDRILYRLSAYSNYELGNTTKDTLTAKSNFSNGLVQIQKFFELTAKDTTKRINLDYEYYGKLYNKVGNDSLGAQFLLKSYAKDTTRFEIFNDLAKIANDKKKYKKAAEYYTKYYKYKKPGLNDLLTWGKAHYFAKEYALADSVFKKVLIQKPDEVLGHKWRAYSNESIDTDRKTGGAVPFYEKYIEVATAKDATKYKDDIIKGYTYMGAYYLNTKQIPKSVEMWKKIGAINPNDENYKFMKKKMAF